MKKIMLISILSLGSKTIISNMNWVANYGLVGKWLRSYLTLQLSRGGVHMDRIFSFSVAVPCNYLTICCASFGGKKINK